MKTSATAPEHRQADMCRLRLKTHAVCAGAMMRLQSRGKWSVSLEFLALEQRELFIIAPSPGSRGSVDKSRLVSSSGTQARMKHHQGAAPTTRRPRVRVGAVDFAGRGLSHKLPALLGRERRGCKEPQGLFSFVRLLGWVF